MKYCYDYPRPAVTVDAVVWRKNSESIDVLLVKRANSPFQGFWALPGGFVDEDETLEQAIIRELQEETGVMGVCLKQLHTFSNPDRDPRFRTITTAFFGEMKADNASVILGSDDAAEAAWFALDKMPKLAFDHDEIVGLAIHQINS